jgi:hypothetical protein
LTWRWHAADAVFDKKQPACQSKFRARQQIRDERQKPENKGKSVTVQGLATGSTTRVCPNITAEEKKGQKKSAKLTEPALSK